MFGSSRKISKRIRIPRVYKSAFRFVWLFGRADLFYWHARREADHLAKLKKVGKRSYTSPDILIANRWMEDTPIVEFRFGLSCSRRDKFFDNYGVKSVTVPTYQRKHLEEMKKAKKLEMYLVFGKRLEKNYAIGVTALREPDFVRYYTNSSTGSERWNDIYYVKGLMNWKEFIKHRIKEGDKEPSLENLYGIEIPWIGE